ncbi:hypothetical protein [Chengkuizengella sediminis]|uniref:hypothetical protein n=1 Tax=Chengkuizengella sediminis TaxID=1885917 RepID=UPI00138945B3|nr:hypothetical protein [Chengkuizengella sediminis]NDI36877.1 hypothetical protein [Chengkuizengella sediminis]
MKKICIVFMLTFILFGCSNEVQETNVTESISLEEQITKVMSENGLNNEEIIDYDIKDNFIYVIFKNKHEYSDNHNPDLVILKNSNGKLEWIAGPDDRTLSIGFGEVSALIFGRDQGSSVTILLPNAISPEEDTNVKVVKVLGEPAKAVTYIREFADYFSKQYMYWIAYTEEEPTPEDFEIIMWNE